MNNDFGAEDRRAQEMASVRQWCEIAAFLGAPMVRVFAGRAQASGPPPEVDPGRIVGTFRKVFGTAQPNARRAWSDAAYALRACADYGEERGVVLALQNARDNPTESDFERVGKVGGGSRPVPTEQYIGRVSRLEDEVRQAEEAVARAEKGR